MRYNHVSPYINLAGTFPIDYDTAKSTSHYIFKYDGKNRIIEIINNHYHTEKQHPLASLGVYKVLITYSKDKEIRIFFVFKYSRINSSIASPHRIEAATIGRSDFKLQ